MTVRKLPGQRLWRVYSHRGRNLGTYRSRAGAERRLRQVEYFKNRN